MRLAGCMRLTGRTLIIVLLLVSRTLHSRLVFQAS